MENISFVILVLFVWTNILQNSNVTFSLDIYCVGKLSLERSDVDIKLYRYHTGRLFILSYPTEENA